MRRFFSNLLVRAHSCCLTGEVRQSLLDMEQTFGLLDSKSSLRDDGKLLYNSKTMGTSITFQKVKFSYRAFRPILNGFDLDIKGGRTTGICGASGCGKSTGKYSGCCSSRILLSVSHKKTVTDSRFCSTSPHFQVL